MFLVVYNRFFRGGVIGGDGMINFIPEDKFRINIFIS